MKMKRIVRSMLVLMTLNGTAWAAEEAVQYKSGAETASAILVTPDGKGPFPGVIVIQEWWGLNDWVKDQARALAKEGYVALAVDLYRGKVATKQEEAHQFMMGLPEERAVSDLVGGFAFLAARPDVRKDRIGAVGWCMGGKYSLKLAVNEARLAAAVAYYGAPPTKDEDIARIKAPVLGNYGADDQGPAPDQVKAFEAAMKKAGKSIDVKIYDGAGHAFANVNNPWGGYREAAAKDAWARTIAFFTANLKKK
jgi:carboxymethylenebutenolidase